MYLFVTVHYVNMMLVTEVNVHSLIQAMITEHLLYCFNDALVMAHFKSDTILIWWIVCNNRKTRTKKPKQMVTFFMMRTIKILLPLYLILS